MLDYKDEVSVVSKWSHSICRPCWDERNPSIQPCCLLEKEVETCCFCGKENSDGIYIRHDPEELLCKGKHDEVNPS